MWLSRCFGKWEASSGICSLITSHTRDEQSCITRLATRQHYTFIDFIGFDKRNCTYNSPSTSRCCDTMRGQSQASVLSGWDCSLSKRCRRIWSLAHGANMVYTSAWILKIPEPLHASLSLSFSETLREPFSWCQRSKSFLESTTNYS